VLDSIARGDVDVAPAPIVATGPSWPRWLLPVGIVVALGLGAAGGWFATRLPASSTPSNIVQFTVPPISGSDGVSVPALSPDGTFVVFVVFHGTSQSLYMQRFDELAPRPIEKTEGASQPFISWDSRWIGFRRQSGLHKVSVDGGDPLPLAENAGSGPGLVWTKDNRIVMTRNWSGALFEVPATGGSLRPLTTIDAEHGERAHWHPSLLPDGQHLLFTVIKEGSGLNDAEIAVLDLRTGAHHTMMPGAAPLYVSPGFLVFFRAGAYQAIRFDAATMTPSGEPMRVLEDARAMIPDGEPLLLSSASTSSLAYRSGSRVPGVLTWVSAGGKLETLPIPARVYTDLSLAPDGHRAAAGVIDAGRYLVRVMDLTRPATDDVLDVPGSNLYPIWNPDGHRLALRTVRGPQYDISLKDLNSAAAPTPFLTSGLDEWIEAWTPTGSDVLVVQANDNGEYPLYKVKTDMPESRVKMSARAGDGRSRVSPDGHWVATLIVRGNRRDLYVLPISGDGQPQRVSDNGAQTMAWSPKGHELYYAKPGEIFSVTYREEGGQFHWDAPRLWAKVEDLDTDTIFDVGPDGRILVGMDQQKAAPSRIRVILGLDKLLEQKLRR